jgi:hypothetical protein
MHYLERLIRRALAVPRDQESALFDPFEQVAPWEPEASALRDTVKIAQVAAMPSRVDAPVALSPKLAPADAAMPSAPEATLTASPLMPPQQHRATPSPLPERGADAGEQAPSTPSVQREATSTEAPLARADAFMRTLGIERPAMLQSATASPAAAVQPPEPEPPSAPRLRVRPSASEPTLLRPVAPRTHAPGTPAVAPRAHAVASPPPPAPAAPAPRRPAPAPQAERVVQTTVVLSPPSRRLDDLAHSSGIARFGLNQS